jgi:hypothetical protein
MTLSKNVMVIVIVMATVMATVMASVTCNRGKRVQYRFRNVEHGLM